ncbi:MAG: hypothetical protein HC900_13060 [Methylacidiphilales bacterium]|nr:hypothetical protein [Candidatus Methylacidiphilales bacterium]
MKKSAVRAIPALDDAMARVDLSAIDARAHRALKEAVRIEAAAGTQWHKFVEQVGYNANELVGLGVFVVARDWTTLFADQIDGNYEYQLPFDRCVFEFSVDQCRYFFLVHHDLGRPRAILMQPAALGGWYPFVFENRDGEWRRLHDPSYSRVPDESPETRAASSILCHVFSDHVAAICIMLDAKVAETRVVRPKTKWARKGHLPEFDYHEIVLRGRSERSETAGNSDEPHRGVRLHFRRGHWRHLADRRVWVNWALVGDPDLGVVEKHYRLK